MKACKAALAVTLILLLLTLGCSRKPAAAKTPAFGPLCKDPLVADCEIGQYGGNLIFPLAADPRSFNPITTEQSTIDVTERVHAPLIQINRFSQQPEPALAKSWEFSADHKTLVLHLREGINFSDGQPFTADDVLFTFTVLFDGKAKSSEADKWKIEGQWPRVEKLNAYTVKFGFPKPLVTAERAFDAIAILPRHKLEAAYRAGQFESAWNKSAAPQEIAGLGPFKLKEYVTGQKITLERNPHYWKVDKKGQRLPYLDQITLPIVPEANNRVLRFQTGELDMQADLRPEDFVALKKMEKEKGLKIVDVGPALTSEFMWFNLNPETDPAAKKPYLNPVKFKWFSDVNFRQAVSYAIDRKGIIDLVFLGKASPTFGPANASNKLWYNPQLRTYEHAPEKSMRLLSQSGFRRNGEDTSLEDASGHRVEFALMTNADNALRQKIGTIIQQDLAKIGIKVNFTPMEFGALINKMQGGNYEACLLGFTGGETDPSSQMNVWLSSSPMHQWYPSQKKPATAYEAKLDELMFKNISAPDFAERKKSFDEVQMLVSENLPFIYLVARNVLVGSKERVGNFKPSILHHRTLWNCDELYFKN